MLEDKEILEVMKNEAYARCRYEIFAEIAREQGLLYYAKVLEEIAFNELSHFREFMRILNLRGDTLENLKTAVIDEEDESTSIYPKLYQDAMVDGKLNTARLFQQITKIEALHKERLDKLADLLETDSVFKRDINIKWKCLTCGYVHEGKEPPNKCPGCQSGQNFYEPEDFLL
jgi:rubrerythrin